MNTKILQQGLEDVVEVVGEAVVGVEAEGFESKIRIMLGYSGLHCVIKAQILYMRITKKIRKLLHV